MFGTTWNQLVNSIKKGDLGVVWHTAIGVGAQLVLGLILIAMKVPIPIAFIPGAALALVVLLLREMKQARGRFIAEGTPDPGVSLIWGRTKHSEWLVPGLVFVLVWFALVLLFGWRFGQ